MESRVSCARVIPVVGRQKEWIAKIEYGMDGLE